MTSTTPQEGRAQLCGWAAQSWSTVWLGPATTMTAAPSAQKVFPAGGQVTSTMPSPPRATGTETTR